MREKGYFTSGSGIYLSEISQFKVLTPQEETRIFARIARGDKNAKRRLIHSNLRLVVSIAKKYSSFGVPLQDLIEEGNIGLLRAAKKYNYKKGVGFAPYASWWIRQKVTRALADQGRVIRIPVYVVEILRKCRRKSHELSQKLERSPTFMELAKAMNLSVEKVRKLEEISTPPRSLDEHLEIDESKGEFYCFARLEDVPSPADNVEILMEHERLVRLVSLLGERQGKILKMRFGLENGIPQTLAGIGKKLKITGERVRQIEKVALETLRKEFGANEEEPGRC